MLASCPTLQIYFNRTNITGSFVRKQWKLRNYFSWGIKNFVNVAVTHVWSMRRQTRKNVDAVTLYDQWTTPVFGGLWSVVGMACYAWKRDQICRRNHGMGKGKLRPSYTWDKRCGYIYPQKQKYVCSACRNTNRCVTWADIIRFFTLFSY